MNPIIHGTWRPRNSQKVGQVCRYCNSIVKLQETNVIPLDLSFYLG